MAVTAAQVKELRERTGLGMMDCKKALVETDGDLEAAVELLRKKGLKTAEKRAGRATSNGWIGLARSEDGRTAALVDLACETDFVAKSDDFQGVLGGFAAHALKMAPASVEEMLEQPMEDGATVAAALQDAVGRIGEKLEIRHVACLTTDDDGAVASYIHHNGQVGVIVKGVVEGGVKDAAALDGLLDKLAKHIAATQPLVIRPEEIPEDILAKERAIYMDSEEVQAKPEKIREGIVQGKLKKFCAERALLEQEFVFESKTKVAAAIARESDAAGGPVSVDGFACFKVGE
jgi:elongation factor Ts